MLTIRAIGRQLRAIQHQLGRACWASLDFVQRRLQSHVPKVISVTKGAVAAKSRKKLCLFAHYDRNNIIDDYVIYYLEQLHAANFETIVVSTSEELSSSSIERARPFCREIVVRENVGYDFGSWKVGLEHAGYLSAYECLLLANDSVYGPLSDLTEFLEAMQGGNLDACGATDSFQIRYHVQSYFLVFQPAVFLSECFARYWTELPYYRFKKTVIWNCELGLSQRLSRAGFRLGALIEYKTLKQSHRTAVDQAESKLFMRRPVNPTLHLWKLLISDYGFPFVKAELLRDNPKKIESVQNWYEFLGQTTGYNVDLISRHLARMRR